MGGPAHNPDMTADAGHLQDNCSYFAHVESHLYQYVAMFRLVKELAESEKAREEFWDGFMNSALGRFIQADTLNSWAKRSRDSAADYADRAQNGSFEDWVNQIGHDWFGYSLPWAEDGSAKAYNERMSREESARAQKLQDAADINYDIAKGKLKEFFVSLWNEIKRRWTQCGALYAIATTATDAAFFVGELALGAGLTAGAIKLLKSIKFMTHLAGVGRAATAATAETVTVTKDTAVTVTAVMGTPGTAMRKIVRTYEADELEAEVRELQAHSGVLREDKQTPLPADDYAKLRAKTPSEKVRRQVRSQYPNATAANPVDDEWLPGLTRTAPVEADHIVSMKEISQMDGFSQLSAANQVEVLNMQDNFTGLSRSANASKGDQTFEQWTTYKKTGTLVNPELRQIFMQREIELRQKIQAEIKRRLAEQASKESPPPVNFRDK